MQFISQFICNELYDRPDRIFNIYKPQSCNKLSLNVSSSSRFNLNTFALLFLDVHGT